MGDVGGAGRGLGPEVKELYRMDGLMDGLREKMDGVRCGVKLM